MCLGRNFHPACALSLLPQMGQLVVKYRSPQQEHSFGHPYQLGAWACCSIHPLGVWCVWARGLGNCGDVLPQLPGDSLLKPRCMNPAGPPSFLFHCRRPF